jgi:hypothetical protein
MRAAPAGIVVFDSDGVIVRRNTVRNFVGTAAAQDAFGIEDCGVSQYSGSPERHRQQ